MSFAINPSLTHIDIPDANILEIYRSKGQIQLPDTRFRGHPCEAVICIAKVEQTVTARVALLETVMNSIFVYTSDYAAEEKADYPKVLAEALDFTAAFGFTMEQVNLEFSPAMREVIIKGIRVMRPPLKKPKLRSLSTSADSPIPPAPVPPITTAHSAERSADPAEINGLKAELAAAQALIEKIGQEKKSLEESSSRERALLESAVTQAAESAKIDTKRFTDEIKKLKAEKQAAADKDLDRRIGELESALHQADTAQNVLRDEIARLTAYNETVVAAKLQLEDELSTEKKSSTAEVSGLKAEIDSLHTRLSTEKSAAKAAAESLASLENSWQESQHREEDLCRNIDIMQEQNDTLTAELEKHRQREGREAALLLRITALEKELEETRAAMHQTASGTPGQSALEAELKSLAAARNDVEVEYIRMANEAMAKETELLENLYAADAEILRLSRELEQQQQEKTALTDEIQRLTLAGVPPAFQANASPRQIDDSAPPITAAPQQLPLITETAKAAEPAAPASSQQAGAVTTTKPQKGEAAAVPVGEDDDTPNEMIIPTEEVTNGLLNEFGSFCSSGHSTTEFTIDPGIQKIEYSDPAEVLAILFSNNSVQAVPDGSSVQRCKGYVVALKQSAHYRVFLAWFMPESDKVLICTPERQPADAAECTQLIHDAVSYFEIVGFMMEVAELGNTVKSYLHAIKKVPALSRV